MARDRGRRTPADRPGTDRVRIHEVLQTEPYMRATYERVPESAVEGVELEALVRSLKDLFRRTAELTAHFTEETVSAVLETEEPARLAYQVAANTRMALEDRQELLEMDDVSEKLRRLIELYTREIDILELGQKIRDDAQSEIGDMQRKYFLQEQLKAIQRELGEDSEQVVEARELAERIAEAGMPEEAEREAKRELDRLSKLPRRCRVFRDSYLSGLADRASWKTVTEDNPTSRLRDRCWTRTTMVSQRSKIA